ncbi:hypothetical protein KUTeg_020935 [Tegillarca granosa]|uniref:Uncharacterized protein n=1 Tax=Tegillarca granosa TaxID=220873 RepID=A0ABQ9EFB9_TEGGR|nr:hypothetical protein KUTeg_020935 [Tegillarca granosa]
MVSGYAVNVYKETDNVIMLYSVELATHYNAPIWYNAPEAWDREILEKIIKEEISKISERLEGYADIMRKAKSF